MIPSPAHFFLAVSSGWMSGGAALAALLLAALLPRMVVRFLRAAPLETGPLRSSLEELARKANVALGEVLSWEDAPGAPGNALGLGYLPRGRRLLLAESLVRRLGRGDVEAVCAHELGHYRHGHSVYALFATLAFVLPLEEIGRGLQGLGQAAAWCGVTLYSLAVWGWILPRLSRRFEQEADLFGAGVVGWRAYKAALHREALQGRLPRSWRHPGGEERLRRLEAAETSASERRREAARARRARAGVVVWCGLSAAIYALSLT